MTDPRTSDRTSDWETVHALSGAYAVDAVDDDERARFEEHLESCPDCREEVQGLREAAALMGGADLAEPPPSVRDGVLAGITGIRPLPPVPTAPEPPVPTAPEPPIDLASRRRFGVGRLPLLVAAAAVLVAAVGGAVWQSLPEDDEAPRLTAAERVLAAEDATELTKRFPDGAQATVVVSRSEGRAVIRTDDMTPAPEGKDYQLWLQTPAGELRPAGLMPDTRDATVLLEGDAARATGIGITVEPDGGSTKPSSEPIAFFTLET